jgi:hypothetical protein
LRRTRKGHGALASACAGQLAAGIADMKPAVRDVEPVRIADVQANPEYAVYGPAAAVAQPARCRRLTATR